MAYFCDYYNPGAWIKQLPDNILFSSHKLSNHSHQLYHTGYQLHVYHTGYQLYHIGHQVSNTYSSSVQHHTDDTNYPGPATNNDILTPHTLPFTAHYLCHTELCHIYSSNLQRQVQ